MKIAIDFDNTIIEEVSYPCREYTPKAHAFEIINKLNDDGHVLYLNTARYGWYFWDAVLFIKRHKLPIHVKITPYKIPADLYIDDRNIGCDNIDWIEIYNIIKCKGG